MIRPIAAFVTAIALASCVFAAEPVSFNTPAISQSTTYSDLITRSSHAVNDYVLAHSTPGTHLANFWVFPTADANTVFVRYTVSDSSAEHLLVVEMTGNRIAKLRDLTSALR